jgi:hypothetical protein
MSSIVKAVAGVLEVAVGFATQQYWLIGLGVSTGFSVLDLRAEKRDRHERD